MNLEKIKIQKQPVASETLPPIDRSEAETRPIDQKIIKNVKGLIENPIIDSEIVDLMGEVAKKLEIKASNESHEEALKLLKSFNREDQYLTMKPLFQDWSLKGKLFEVTIAGEEPMVVKFEDASFKNGEVVFLLKIGADEVKEIPVSSIDALSGVPDGGH